MKLFYATWGVLMTGMAILSAYALAGPMETLPWEGYGLLWLATAIGFAEGLFFFRIAR